MGRLRRLTLRNCGRVTEHGVHGVVQRCARLGVLDVSGCPSVTDLRCVTALKGLHVRAGVACDVGCAAGVMLHGVVGVPCGSLHVHWCGVKWAPRWGVAAATPG